MCGLPWKLALALGVLAGCGRKPESAQTPAADTAGKMTGMAMQAMQMMPLMQAHLDSLGSMPPEQMAAMMSAHQDLSSRTMDAMGADMRSMNMQADSAWNALADSLRRDLAELPALSGVPLKDRMERHIARMRRIMATHREMMKM